MYCLDQIKAAKRTKKPFHLEDTFFHFSSNHLLTYKISRLLYDKRNGTVHIIIQQRINRFLLFVIHWYKKILMNSLGGEKCQTTNCFRILVECWVPI
mgnify:CR=1 FL=1